MVRGHGVRPIDHYMAYSRSSSMIVTDYDHHTVASMMVEVVACAGSDQDHSYTNYMLQVLKNT
jgi:hypothetical protein